MLERAHEDLAAYVLGRLDPEEAERFRLHLADCDRCRVEEGALRSVITVLRGTRPSAPPADLEARTLAAVAAAAGAGSSTRDVSVAASAPPAVEAPARPRDELAARRRRLPKVAAAAAAVAAGLVVAFVVGAGTEEDTVTTAANTRTVTRTDTRLPGELEKTATLTGDGFSAAARVNVIGPGRLVEVKSDTVPIIPKGTYYELWFVGSGDAPGTPNRISAGTWHPDTRGITDVRFLIAADPELFPDIEVTEEPPDGDPAPSGRVVLASS